MVVLPFTIAYLSNEFPATVEPYVIDEISELRARGMSVIPCSARSARASSLGPAEKLFAAETLNLDRIRPLKLLQSLFVFVTQLPRLASILLRLIAPGPETAGQRVRALAHTFLGVYLAILLEKRGARHIHVHHGYFSAWIGMVAARVLGGTFSITLHGSDLLVHASFLDIKLRECRFCVTVSDYNRAYLLDRYPFLDPEKVVVQRLGVEIPPVQPSPERSRKGFTLLAVGRLHAVKNHTFLLRACHALKQRGLSVACAIAGEGPERRQLERLIRELSLDKEITLLGHVPRGELDRHYRQADLVALTSHSEGAPVVLMEAMVRECLVLAPAITGIPELVKHGETGFLYSSDSLESFVGLAREIFRSHSALDSIRHHARLHICRHFHRDKNLTAFADCFLARVASLEKPSYEDSLLQQVQPRLQRNGSLPVRTDGNDAVAGP